jgi:hypothetical protein
VLGAGPRALLYRLRCLLKRREVDVWYDPAYRLPLTGVEFSGIDLRRSDFAAWWLRESKAIAAPWWRAPRRASYAELSRVHDAALLESLSRPETLGAVFGVDPTDVPVDEVMKTVRLATGATVQAAGEALRRNKPQLNLLGGFHHAGPSSAGGNCPVNDIAVAIAAVRADGFEGKVAVLDLDAHPPDGIAACLARDPNSWIGSRWSRIQMDRPCVASSIALSRGCSVISSIRTVGRFPLMRCHVLARSSDTNSPASVPR